MHSRDANTSFAGTIVDEWVRGGVTDAVISPGSRSTPLALALVRDGRIRSHVVLDERSAAFFALGIGKATGVPAVLLCTSGTAAANFHPAVVEAHHARVPLLVCTADRPTELLDVGAPQTIRQANLYGDAVRWFHDPGPPTDEPDAGARWRTLACRALAHATGSPPGPVHLNLPFREPLVPTGAPLVDAPGRPDGAPWVRDARVERGEGVRFDARTVANARRGVVVAGFGTRDPEAVVRFAAAAGWPVLADAVSNTRRDANAIAYEALVRNEPFLAAHAPDIVVRAGAPLTSKAANAWLDGLPTVLVDPDDEWLDPGRATVERVVADETLVFDALTASIEHTADSDWLASWVDASGVARRAMDGVLDADDIDCEARVARDVSDVVPSAAQLVVASSLPVRALEWCMAARDDVTVHANRGANGIDGFVSTALGIAAASKRPTVALCGDLCFLHDVNGLLGVAERGVDATFVVVDNRGGGIFGYLAQRDLPEFERLFATPQSVGIAAVAQTYGATVTREPVKDVIGRPGCNVVVVDVDREASARKHTRMWQAAAHSLAGFGV